KYLGFSYVDMIRDIKIESDREFKVYILGEGDEFKKFSELNDNNYIYQKTEVDYKNIGLLLLSGGTTRIPTLIPRRHCDYLYVAKKTSIISGMDRG
ncbi:hypothetical protein ABTO05_20015, partial [Acinetobacter baumannii]